MPARFTLTETEPCPSPQRPNYEAPSDAGDNTYVVGIRATDIAGNGVDQTMVVTVVNANEAPAFDGLVRGERSRERGAWLRGRAIAESPIRIGATRFSIVWSMGSATMASPPRCEAIWS
jgi:hypothetical protein